MISKLTFYISLGSLDLDPFTLYQALNEKIERTSKLMFMILMKIVVPVTLVPPFIISVVNYYMLELGEESFRTPTPIG